MSWFFLIKSVVFYVKIYSCFLGREIRRQVFRITIFFCFWRTSIIWSPCTLFEMVYWVLWTQRRDIINIFLNGFLGPYCNVLHYAKHSWYHCRSEVKWKGPFRFPLLLMKGIWKQDNGKSHSSWFARFDRKIPFRIPRVFPLVYERSLWHKGNHPG